MLYRKAYDKLLAWKKQKNRTALCIQGARQIAVQAGARPREEKINKI